jgi:hypothetical protein
MFETNYLAIVVAIDQQFPSYLEVFIRSFQVLKQQTTPARFSSFVVSRAGA